MVEYIERESAIKAIDDEVSLDGLYANIKAIPAAYVQKVKHGKWEDYGHNLSAVRCSACKHIFDSSMYGYAFCPCCGAKMNGGTHSQ